MNGKSIGLMAALLALALAPGAALAGSGNGNGHQDRVKGKGRTGQLEVQVNARTSRKSGAEGKLHFRDLGDPASPLNFKGRVSCLHVDGDDAVVAGVIEEFGSQVADSPGGGVFYVFVTDGEEADEDVDLWSAMLLLGEGQPAPDTCTASPGGTPVERGDFKVRDGPA